MAIVDNKIHNLLSPQLHCSQPRHFYVVVDRLQFKMETLVDLLGVAGWHTCLPMVVCCSSRDELDAVCSVVSNLPYISFSSLYSDLVESERTRVLETFRQAKVSWNQNASAQSGDDSETGKDEQKSRMIVVTDACLPVLGYFLLPENHSYLLEFS